MCFGLEYLGYTRIYDQLLSRWSWVCCLASLLLSNDRRHLGWLSSTPTVAIEVWVHCLSVNTVLIDKIWHCICIPSPILPCGSSEYCVLPMGMEEVSTNRNTNQRNRCCVCCGAQRVQVSCVEAYPRISIHRDAGSYVLVGETESHYPQFRHANRIAQVHAIGILGDTRDPVHYTETKHIVA